MNIRTKLTLILLALAAVVLLAAGIFTERNVDHYLRSRISDELATEMDIVEYQIRAGGVPDSGSYGFLRSLAARGKFRLTLIRADGTVIFDSDVREEYLGTLENHAARPEFAAALSGGTGTSTRHSVTTDRDLLYVARPVAPPADSAAPFGTAAAIRLSIPITEVNSALAGIRATILLVSLLVFAAVVVVVGYVSRRLSDPIAEMAGVASHIRSGSFDRRIAVRSNDELGRLGASLNEMIDKLDDDITRLRKLERVRTEFLGNVSHELRTPIFAIQGMLETLLNGAVDDPEVNRDFLERALRNTRNLNALLNDLIEISRIESGDMKMSFRYFDVVEFVRQVAGELQVLAEKRRIALTVNTPAVSVNVYGDRERLKQALVNLIENAVKYNNDAGWVRVSAADEGDRVGVAVEDGGIGIPPEHVGRIFERFYRVDKERSRDTGGTGLGLAIVKHIVEAHGSAVSVESSPGSGSAFRFSLRKLPPP